MMPVRAVQDGSNLGARCAVLQRSSDHKSVVFPVAMMDAACCATVDIKAFSQLMDTSLYPVTLAWTIPTVQLAESTVSQSTRCCSGSRPTCQYATVS